MYQLFTIPLMLVMGLRTLSRVSNYPYLLFCNFILSTLTRFFPDNVLFALGSITLYQNDITILFLLLTMIAHKEEFTVKRKNINIVIAISFLTILFSFAIGLVSYGVNTWIIADIRKFFYHIVLIFFATTCNVKINIQLVKKWAKRIAYVLVVYIYVATVIHYVFGMQIGVYTDERPLTSHFAITLVIYILYDVYDQLYNSKNPSISLKTVIAIVSVIINRFNTTWVAMLAGIFVLIIFMPEKKKLFNTKNFIILLGVATILISMVTVFNGSSLMTAVYETGDKFKNMGSEDTTFGTRTELWASMLSRLNKRTIWTGLPMGSGYAVYYRGALWKFDPHNGYVETIMRTGIIGCVTLIICYLSGIIASIKNKKNLGAAIIIAMMVYFIAYTYEFELSFILGYILAKQMKDK